MATEKQRRANRLNARRSTGPRTDAGKQESRWNALRHGLAAQSPVLPHEDAAAFHDMRAALIEHYQPANIQERQLIDHIAHAQMRMERSRRFENRMFDLQLRHAKRTHRRGPEPDRDDDTGIAACMCSTEFEQGYNILFRYDSRAEAAYFKAVNALHRSREARLRRERAEHIRASRKPLMIPAAVALEPPAIVVPASEHLPQLVDSAAETAKLASFGHSANIVATGAPNGQTATVTVQAAAPSVSHGAQTYLPPQKTNRGRATHDAHPIDTGPPGR